MSRDGDVKRALAGVFVGGKSSRMGGKPKGLLVGPHGMPLLAKLIELARAECGEVVLVGDTEAYRELCPDVPAIADAPGIEGPLAGLDALLRHAGERRAIALACDLPFVEAPLLHRLATLELDADVLAPRLEPSAPWEPLFARYETPRVLPKLEAAIARGIRSFQKLFRELRVAELPLDVDERTQLRDWDSPGDLDPGQNS